jgi:hypothetical protein
MTETRKSQKKVVKESLIMAEGGATADYDFARLDTCILKTSEVSPDMGCLIIVLNLILSPIGTFLAAGLDKRGLNKWLLGVGVAQLIPTILFQVYMKMLESANAPENIDKNMTPQEAADAVVGIFTVLCIFATLFVMSWIYGICLACHIKNTNQNRVRAGK